MNLWFIDELKQHSVLQATRTHHDTFHRSVVFLRRYSKHSSCRGISEFCFCLKATKSLCVCRFSHTSKKRRTENVDNTVFSLVFTGTTVCESKIRIFLDEMMSVYGISSLGTETLSCDATTRLETFLIRIVVLWKCFCMKEQQRCTRQRT